MAVISVNDLDFQTYLEGGKPFVVKYYADWCGSCKLFAPKYRRLSEDPRFGHIPFLEVNAEQEPQARKAARVDNLPFLAVFQNGELVEGQAGSKEEVLLGLLQKITHETT